MSYPTVVDSYRERQWSGVLPLPPNAKASPPSGYTGVFGSDPTDTQIEEWAAEFPDGNVALRLPDGVVGIDVDDYGAKRGLTTYRLAQDRWGNLPPTWLSTARNGGSGIRFFRCPRNMPFPGTLALDGHSDVEIIQRGHRYAVVWPSVHPSGAFYCWYRPDGSQTDIPPAVSDLPELPAAWVDGLRALGGMVGQGSRKRDISYGDAIAQLQGYMDPTGDPCEALRERLDAAIGRLNDPGARHDHALFDSLAIVGMAHDGHSGILTALDELSREFVSRVSADRPDADAEFERMLIGALAKVSGPPRDFDPCGDTPDAKFEREVQDALRKLEVREEAKIRFNSIQAGELHVPALESTWDLAKEVPEAVDWLVEGLIPRNGVAALSAEKKTGKTTIVHKLIESIIGDGEFLERFRCHKPNGSVAIYDLEMPSDTLGYWLNRNGIARREGVYAVSLRGQVTNLNVLNATHRSSIAADLKARNCKLLVVDPLGPYLRMLGADESDATEAGRALDALIALKEEACIDTLVVPLHAGHGDKTRARGSSVLQDTPDVNISLFKESSTSEIRRLSAEGRDVDVDIVSFTYSLDTGEITVVNEGDDKRSADVLKVLGFLEEVPGAKQGAIVTALQRRERWGKQRSLGAIQTAEAQGFVVIERQGDGAKSPQIHTLTSFGEGELTQARRVLGEDV